MVLSVLTDQHIKSGQTYELIPNNLLTKNMVYHTKEIPL